MGARRHLVGRDSERERIAELLSEAARGSPGAVLVAGEPGVGKTSLVDEAACDAETAGHLVLWGRCLRFGAESSPYLPLAQMLTQWHRQADEFERERVLAGAGHLGAVAPALGAWDGPVETTRVMPQVALVLDRIAETSPLALVVDDVQWADGSSLNLLAYLMVGFRDGQRLSVLTTYRDTELVDGHRLHGWLADVSRLPSVSQLRLERLGFADAVELVARLGGASGPRLASKVFEKAEGNPYYTELLVRGAATTQGSEPDEGLRHALLSSWHRLDSVARELLQMLAIGGRPVAVEILERVAAARGQSSDQVASGLAAAAQAGLTTRGTDEAWFHHPLIAEVVASTLSRPARLAIHREYVKVLESTVETSTASRAAHLALHHEGAGHVDEAFRWSLVAADAAAAVRGYAETSDHLRRACELWEEASDDARAVAGDRINLWQRASQSAWSAGQHHLAVRLREEAIALADVDEGDPVRGLRLRLPLHFCRIVSGLEKGPDVDKTQSVLNLALRRSAGSVEHVVALAQLAFAQRWAGDPSAAACIDQALRMARRTGAIEALAWALAVRSQIEPDALRALTDAEQALVLACELGTPELMGHTAVVTANCLCNLGRISDAADTLLSMFRRLITQGSVQDATWAQPEFAAWMLLELGRWGEGRALIRELLGHRLPARSAAETRVVAALLAFRTGDLEAGRTHLVRARELFPDRGPGNLLYPADVEELWSCGEPKKAVELVADIMEPWALVDPEGADELLVVAARAAGDLSERPGARQDAVRLLSLVERRRGADAAARFHACAPGDLVHAARASLFAAERGRCHGDPDASALWRTAVSTCAEAGMVWHQALASYHLARALLATVGSRQEAASALRQAARIATELGARPILQDAEELARQARIPLDAPVAAETLPDPTAGLPPLTRREREVLGHLVAGRTYAETGAALFISEKTVSVHVSNLLRKTGTSSRVELAELVRRSG